MNAPDFILAVFNRLETTGIPYAVLRKADEIVKGTAHDIDMALDFQRIKEALLILDRVAEELGWKCILTTDKDQGNLKAVHFARYGSGKPETVHFDLFRCFSWNGTVLLNNRDLLKDRRRCCGIACVSDVNEVTIKLLSRLIYHGYVKEAYRKEIQQFACGHRPELTARLSICIGGEAADQLAASAASGLWTAIGEMKNQLREAAVNLHGAVPFSERMLFKMKRFLRPGGVMIAFLGADGSGKSTIIASLPDYMGNTFDRSQIQYYHWRPGFLRSPKGRKSGASGDPSVPHQKKPYGRLLSFLKFSYFNLDYILGYWFDIKKRLGRNELVVFDRYYYDYFLDKYRYRLNLPDPVIFFFRHLIPRPDITFALTGTPEILYARKQELSAEELLQQKFRLSETVTKIPGCSVINADAPIDVVASNVCSEILGFMAWRNERKREK